VGLHMTLFSLTGPFRVRASTIAIARFHGQTQGGSRFYPDRQVIQNPESWFVKVVSTLFVNSHSLDACLNYLCEKLTPLIAFEVIKRFNNPKVGFKFLEFSRLNLNVNHCYSTYNLLMRSLCQMGHHDLVNIVFDYMGSDGHLPDSKLLGFLVTWMAQASDFDMVKKLLAEVQGKEVRINSFVYNNLLSVLVKQNQVHEAIYLFKEYLAMQSPDTWTFNILIRGLCRVGGVDRAFEFFKDMESFGCLPDVVTYNTLINGLCKANEVQRGCELFKEIQSRSDCSPDIVTYTSIISGFCKSGKMKEASNLFEEMMRSGIQPNVITFNVLIDGFGKIGNIAEAEAMYRKMAYFDCSADVVTFTSLIDGYCRAGQVNHGLKFWNVMKTRNVSPTVYTYAVLINALCKENRLNEARDFLGQIKNSSIIPKPFMYNPVIDGFCKAGNVDEGNVILKEMEEKRCDPDKVTFTILIIGHCVKGRMFEAINIFNRMLATRCAPDNITVNSLISCLLKAGMPNEAYRIRKMALEDRNLGLSSVEKAIPLRTNTDIPVAV